MTRSIVAVLLTLGSIQLTSCALAPTWAWLVPDLVDGDGFAAISLPIVFGVGCLVWRSIVRDEFALSMLVFRVKPVLVHLAVSGALFLLPALVLALCVTPATFQSNWWSLEIDKPSGLREMLLLSLFAAEEEMLHRYLILGATIRLTGSKIVGLLVTTALFVLLHLHSNNYYIAAGGLWFGAIALSTRSIWPAAAAHFAANVVIQILFASSPLAHPMLLGAPVQDQFNQLIIGATLPISLYLLWPTLKGDPALIAAKTMALRLWGISGRPA